MPSVATDSRHATTTVFVTTAVRSCTPLTSPSPYPSPLLGHLFPYPLFFPQTTNCGDRTPKETANNNSDDYLGTLDGMRTSTHWTTLPCRCPPPCLSSEWQTLPFPTQFSNKVPEEEQLSIHSN